MLHNLDMHVGTARSIQLSIVDKAIGGCNNVVVAYDVR